MDFGLRSTVLNHLSAVELSTLDNTNKVGFEPTTPLFETAKTVHACLRLRGHYDQQYQHYCKITVSAVSPHCYFIF
jgi:hypothetical protein